MLRVLSLLLLLFLLPVCSFAREASCPAPANLISVIAETSAPAEICPAAVRALGFLADYGLKPQRPVRLQLVEHKIAANGADAYGSYDSRSDLIELMSLAAIKAETPPARIYGELFDPVHYAGAVAHEIAHAVVQHNLESKPRSPGPQEYLAHATQLAVLPPARRAAIITAMAVGPWLSGDVISDIYMALEPGRFAVKSYLHLTGMNQPKAFVQLLLTAKWFYVTVP
jgi:hypothetical protein